MSAVLGPGRLWWTKRHGGVSEPPRWSLNLSEGVGDSPAAVAENRRRLAAALGLRRPWAWLRQVHGADVVAVGEAPPEMWEPPEADAAVTRVAGIPLVVVGADCAMVALACDDAVGVAHTGHAGLLAGVLEAAVESLRRLGSGPVRAYLGPCIHPARYEFGARDLDRVVAHLGPACAATTASGRPALDLPAAVRAALRRAGVDDLEEAGVCTAASPDLFSHRRDGLTGRQALVVVLGEETEGGR